MLHKKQALTRSEVELSASPVATGSIVSDLVVGSVSDPVGKRSVRFQFSGIAGLLTESFDSAHLD